MLKKKIWANFQRMNSLPKIVTKLSKIWVWDPGSDPGSGKNLFRIPDPGVKKASDPDPQHCNRNMNSGARTTKLVVCRGVGHVAMAATKLVAREGRQSTLENADDED